MAVPAGQGGWRARRASPERPRTPDAMPAAAPRDAVGMDRGMPAWHRPAEPAGRKPTGSAAHRTPQSNHQDQSQLRRRSLTPAHDLRGRGEVARPRPGRASGLKHTPTDGRAPTGPCAG